MACPFFTPIERLDDGSWPHPARLPLGGGWSGHCAAPGHEGVVPSHEELREFCNLGYAEECSRLPRERAWDAVRFAITAVRSGDGHGASEIRLRYVCERGHRPAEHGVLEFRVVGSQWVRRHPDNRVQKMAECFLEEYLNRGRRQNAERLEIRDGDKYVAAAPEANDRGVAEWAVDKSRFLDSAELPERRAILRRSK